MDEFGDEVVVALAADAFMALAEVELVVEKFFVVGAAVEDHGKGAVGVDAGAKGVDD